MLHTSKFGEIHPHLAELSGASSKPDFFRHMEAVVLAAPDAETALV